MGSGVDLWPILSCVVDSQDFYRLGRDLIDEDIRPAWKGDFTGAWDAAFAASVREVFECVACVEDGFGHFPCSIRFVASDETSDKDEVFRGWGWSSGRSWLSDGLLQ